MTYDDLRQVTPQAAVLLQDNPGPMTLDGTNTWLLGRGGAIVVDPGQGEDPDRHVPALLAAAADVELIVVTHRHHDHAELAPALHAATGAPVRAADPTLCLGGAPLADGELLAAGGVEAQVLATPGHTSDSICLLLDSGPVLTGDTILGRGTTVVAHPDGALAPYLDSLARLRELGDRLVLPGHGPQLPSLAVTAGQYLAHRSQRLDQVRAALETLGADASARQIVEHVYADVDESVWWAAELSVRAQLDYLR
ncbi:MAG TPA: MBL fold metallo-hydrolase [Jatrophihabitans sp.]|jgi:glyoxylase-like metal-dependent hydrolase (beta-lactamase superfamily II)